MSSRLFREVNENDARASVKAYAKMIAERGGVIADPSPRVFKGTEELTKLLKRGEADLVSMQTQEFLALEENLVTGPILVSIVNGCDSEEYLLLVRADSGAKALTPI